MEPLDAKLLYEVLGQCGETFHLHRRPGATGYVAVISFQEKVLLVPMTLQQLEMLSMQIQEEIKEVKGGE